MTTKTNLKPSILLSNSDKLKKVYSEYDTTGKLWDTLDNWKTSLKLKPSDSINRNRTIPNYSVYDNSGIYWDSLQNPIYNTNNSTFSKPSNPEFDKFRLAEGSQTPITNQLDLIVTKTSAVPLWAKPYVMDQTTYPSGQRTQQENVEQQRYNPSSLYNTDANTFDFQTYFNLKEKKFLNKNIDMVDYINLKMTTDGSILQDFRQFNRDIKLVRRDGTASLNRNTKSAASQALSTLNSLATTEKNSGTYGVFDRELYFGMGNLGDSRIDSSLRKDFTLQTEASTIWRLGGWVRNDKTQNVPFRGDKVTARDFGTGTAKSVYRWKQGVVGLSTGILRNSLIGKIANVVTSTFGAELDQTRDFIKFYFLGPINGTANQLFDIFVFRSTIKSLTDSFSPQWSPVDYIGRADKNYIYSSFERTVDITFSVYATSRDELKPMWRKLNYLATYTMPEYDSNYIMYRGKYLKITIGDLYIDQPVLINNLYYTLHEPDTTWEINIEDDSTHKQVPLRVDINLTLRMLTNHLPQYMGQAYSLYDQNTGNVPGSENWLSDSVTTNNAITQATGLLSDGQLSLPKSTNGPLNVLKNI